MTAESGSLEQASKGQSTALASNAIVNLSGSIAYYVAVVIVTPIAIGALGEKLWGIWQLVGAVTAYALLINLGLSGAVSYHVANAIAREDTAALRRAIHHARVYFAGAGLLICVVFVLGGWPIARWLTDGEDHAITFAALITSTVLTGLALPLQIFLSVISGMQRYDILAISRLVGGLAIVGSITVGFFWLEMGLVWFVALMTLGPIVPAAICFVSTHRLLPRDALGWGGIDRTFLWEMIGYGFNTVIYTTGTIVLFQSMKFLAAWKAGGPEAAGRTGLVISVVQLLSLLLIPIASVLHPRVRDLSSRGRDAELPALLERSLTATGCIALPIIAFMAAEADLIFEAWVGSSIAAGDIAVLGDMVRLMLIGQGPFILFLPCFYVLVGLGEHRIFGIGMLGAGAVNALAGWGVLEFAPELASLALVFGLTLAALVFAVTVPATFRRFGIRYVPGIWRSLARPVLITMPGVAFLSLVAPDLGHALLDLVVTAAGFGIATLPGLWIVRSSLAP